MLGGGADGASPTRVREAPPAAPPADDDAAAVARGSRKEYEALRRNGGIGRAARARQRAEAAESAKIEAERWSVGGDRGAKRARREASVMLMGRCRPSEPGRGSSDEASVTSSVGRAHKRSGESQPTSTQRRAAVEPRRGALPVLSSKYRASNLPCAPARHPRPWRPVDSP